MTHVGSDVHHFRRTLTAHPDIDFFQTPMTHIYDGYDSLNYLNNANHKASHAAAIFMDQIEHNYRFQKKMLLPEFKYIFYIGEPRTSMHNIHETSTVLYYTYRLQGIYEYIVRTKGLVITHDNWKLDEVEKYLNLRGGLTGEPQPTVLQERASYESVLKAQRVYDDFLHKLKTLKVS